MWRIAHFSCTLQFFCHTFIFVVFCGVFFFYVEMLLLFSAIRYFCDSMLFVFVVCFLLFLYVPLYLPASRMRHQPILSLALTHTLSQLLFHSPSWHGVEFTSPETTCFAHILYCIMSSLVANCLVTTTTNIQIYSIQWYFIAIYVYMYVYECGISCRLTLPPPSWRIER